MDADVRFEKCVNMLKYYMVKIRKKLSLSAIKNSKIDKQAYISGGSTVLCSEIGKYTYTGYDVSIIYTKIGRFCSIADNCKIGGASHPIQWISTSPLFHCGKNVFRKQFSQHEYEPYSYTHIGNDVWIGQNVLIKSGVTIGNGAVIGMGAVVTRDIGAYEIWAGNPARLIRKRFNDDVICQLEKKQWWMWEDEKIRQYAKYMKSVHDFCGHEEELKK